MAEEIFPEIYWVGVNYYTNDLFEGIWPIPYGVSLNSYLVKGRDKIALIDLVKAGGGSNTDTLRAQLESVGVKVGDIDIIVLNHLEPDHTGFLSEFMNEASRARILTTPKGAELVKAFYGITDRVGTVNDGDSVDLGGKTLRFYHAPNVHWPETMVTYCPEHGLLFSCDAFGSFGALKGAIFDDQLTEADNEFFEFESLRYYANIVGAFSPFVLKAIDKLSGLDIKVIAPSHGIIWRKNPGKIIERYVKYANYMNGKAEPEITVVWGTMYGNTERMMRAVLKGIAEKGVRTNICKVPETDVSYVLAYAWRSSGLVIACPTYEYKLFPPMLYVLDLFNYKHVYGRKVVRIGSFGWSGGAQKHFEEKIARLKWDMVGVLEYRGAASSEDIEKGIELGRKLAEEVLKLSSEK